MGCDVAGVGWGNRGLRREIMGAVCERREKMGRDVISGWGPCDVAGAANFGSRLLHKVSVTLTRAAATWLLIL
jgi:hypothetical protein